MKFSIRTVAAAVIAVSALAAGTAHAAGEADIAYRKAVMKAIGGQMTSMSTMLKSGTGDFKNIALHAEGMAGLAKIAPTAFPAGSGPEAGKTDAKADIWTKKDDFAKHLAAFSMEADKLAAVAKTGDKGEIGKQLGALGKNGCKACHDAYKEK